MHFGTPVQLPEDDEVVCSINVYYSPPTRYNTHVFLYPLRPSTRPYETESVNLFSTAGGDGSIQKPDVIDGDSRMTMVRSLDPFGSPSFRSLQGDEKYSYTLQSQPFHSHSDFAVGVFMQNGLYVTTASSVHSFLPAVRGTAQQGPLKVEPEHCSTQVAPMTPGVGVNDRNQRDLMKQRSVMINGDAATAQSVMYFMSNTVESSVTRQQVFSSTMESANRPLDSRIMSTVEDSLYPAEILSRGGITGGEHAVASPVIHRFASQRSVADQVAQLMIRCHVMSWPMIKQAVVSDASDDEIVRELKKNAIYMHGVWACVTSTTLKGIGAAILELVLAFFYKSSTATVARKDLNTALKTSKLRRIGREALESVADLNSDEPDPTLRRWKLRYSSAELDKEFAARFPQEVAAQAELWTRAVPQILSHVSHLNADKSVPALALSRGSSDRRGKAETVKVPVGAAPIDPAALRPITQFIRALFMEHGVINKQRAKDMVLSARETNYPTATNQMLSAALQSQVKGFTQSTWVLQKVEDPKVNEFRPIILEAALRLGTFDTAALWKVVDEMAQTRGVSAVKLEGEEHTVPRAVLQHVLSEVAEYKGGERLWCLKNGFITS